MAYLKPIPDMDTAAQYRHPRTGTVWTFPKDAKRYLGLVEAHRTRHGDAQPCEHGHYGCAVWERGPCSDMVYATFVAEDTEEDQARAQENADLDASVEQVGEPQEVHLVTRKKTLGKIDTIEQQALWSAQHTGTVLRALVRIAERPEDTPGRNIARNTLDDIGLPLHYKED